MSVLGQSRRVLFGVVAGLAVVGVPVSTAPEADGRGMLKVTVDVELSCPSCAQGVVRRLSRLDNVAEVEVLAAAGQIVVTPERGTSVDLDAIHEVARNAGFAPTGLGLTAAGRVIAVDDAPTLELPDTVLLLVDDDRVRTLVTRGAGAVVTVSGRVRLAGADGETALQVEAVDLP